MTDNDTRGWVRNESIQGGWVVYCRLCGKRTRRTFIASMTNYAEAEKAARSYRNDHAESAEHRAALEAFYAEDPPEVNETEALIARAFGNDPPDEQTRRRRAARDAAALVRRQPSE